MSLSSSWPYHSLGEGRRPPLVFLHGFMGAGVDWLSVAEICAERFFCVLPDLPGHGQNIHLPISSPLDFDSLADGLRALLEQLELDRVNLVGYSMGGRIALYTALKFPEKFGTLVLESASPGIAGPEARRARAELDDKRAATLLAGGIDNFVEGWYELELFKSLKDRPLLFEEVKERRKQNDVRWMAKIIRELSPGRQPALWEKLGALPLPALLVTGALDSTYAALMAAMGRYIPGAVVEILPKAGHNTHLENPHRFAELVMNFPRP